MTIFIVLFIIWVLFVILGCSLDDQIHGIKNRIGVFISGCFFGGLALSFICLIYSFIGFAIYEKEITVEKTPLHLIDGKVIVGRDGVFTLYQKDPFINSYRFREFILDNEAKEPYILTETKEVRKAWYIVPFDLTTKKVILPENVQFELK